MVVLKRKNELNQVIRFLFGISLLLCQAVYAKEQEVLCRRAWATKEIRLTSKYRLEDTTTSTGVETYQDLLGRLARFSLDTDSLSPQQMKALETYHSIVRGEKGTDGTLSRAGNYTVGQRRRIIKFLEKEFSREQVRTLIEDGIIEINRMEIEIGSSQIFKRISKGQVTFFTSKYHGYHPIRISKILERTDAGLLVEVEKIDPESGQVIKSKAFFMRESTHRIYESTMLSNPMWRMHKILERTDRGFVLEGLYGAKHFFSFEEAIENGLLPENPTFQDYRKMEDTLNDILQNKDKVIGYFQGDDILMRNREDSYRHFMSLLEKALVRPELSVLGLNPEFEAVFLAAQSNREKVSAHDINLPPSTNREAELAEQGYKTGFTGGINQVNKWVIMQRQLKELKANPWTTHLEYLEDQVHDDIAYIKRGLENNYFPDSKSVGSKLDQLKHLKDLEKEAEEAISNGGVTYKWLLEFYLKLSKVMAGMNPESSDYLVSKNVNESVIYFPLKMIAPTANANIGIMTANRTSPEGVYPVSLINYRTRIADGNSPLNAFKYQTHDYGHAGFLGNRLFLEYSLGHRLFHKRLLVNIENLAPVKGKKSETLYYLMTHENQEGKNISYANWTPQQMRKEVMTSIYWNGTNLFKFSDDPIEKQEKKEDLADTFMEVYNQAQQHQWNIQ